MPYGTEYQHLSISTLILSIVASYSFNLAETEAFVRLDSNKSDYLDFNGDVKEDLNCSLFHCIIITWCRTIGSLSSTSPSVIFKKRTSV